jgi:AraC-like DNA-binding protein
MRESATRARDGRSTAAARRIIPSIYLRGVWEELTRRGLDLRELQKKAGVHLPPSDEPTASIVDSDLHALLALAATHLGEPHLGLSLGRALNAASFHLVGPLILASPSLGSAIETILRVAPYVRGGLTLCLEVDGHSVRFGFRGLPHSSVGARIEAGLIVSMMAHFAQHFLAPDDPPLSVSFAMAPPRDVAPYLRAFPGSVSFDAELTGVGFTRAAFERRRAGGDTRLPDRLSKMVEEELVPLDACGSWAERARIALRRHVAAHQITPRELARELGTTVRGLTRRLALEGYTYSALRDEVLFERARALLGRPTLSIADVASSLGYAELSSFYRAFRRWSGGQKPGDFRAEGEAESPETARENGGEDTAMGRFGH